MLCYSGQERVLSNGEGKIDVEDLRRKKVREKVLIGYNFFPFLIGSLEPESGLLGLEKISFWSTKEQRRKWENDFVTIFVRKILMVNGFFLLSIE